MKTIKLLTWNIRQGGRKAIQEIVVALNFHDADLIVITEFKENPSGQYLTEQFQRVQNYSDHSILMADLNMQR